MTLNTNLWQFESGASHRKNFDTPPLKGLCLEPFRFQLGSRRDELVYAPRPIFTVPFGTVVASAG
jgi:hypothetical protein